VQLSKLWRPLASPTDKSLPKEAAADLATHRAFLLLGIGLNFLLWIVHRATNPAVLDPLWGRILFGLVPGALFVASYVSPGIRRRFLLFWRLTLYLLVAWYTGLCLLNEMSPSYSIGCMFTVAGACLAFNVGLDRRWPLIPFLAWCALLPGTAALAAPMTEEVRGIFLACLAGLVLFAYLVLGRNVQTKRSLRQERDRFETLYQNLPTPAAQIVWDDGEPTVASVNETFLTVFGQGAGGGLGRTLHEMIVPDNLEARARARHLREWVRNESRFQTEVERVTRGGTRTFQLNVAGREREDGTREAYVIYTDISGQKRRQRQLQEAKEEAEKASRLKSTMLANVSHELRTPLTSIIGFSEMLEERLDGEPGQFAETVSKGARRLMGTLNAMLHLSEMEAEGVSLRSSPVSLRRVTRETAELMDPKAKEKGVEVQIDSNGEAPVPWKPEALRRVTTNLLDNAIKFTPEGGTVSLRIHEEPEHTVLEVEDTGVGIAEDAETEIFEAFKQESSGKGRSYEGSGLGLAITRRIVDKIGGAIAVDSEKGVGTTFTVRIPRASSASDVQPKAGAESPRGSPQ
jgi:PAS domain S-box-containing protein